MKKFISYLLVTVMLIALMPLAAFASGEPTYLDVDYGEKLTVGTIKNDYIHTDAPDIYERLYGWYGIAQGYTVSLEAKQVYSFTITIHSADATYIDRAAALLNKELTGDESVDMLDYNYTYDYGDETGTTSILICDFSVETAGDYKLLVWGYCEDIYGNAVSGSDKTSMSIEISEKDSYLDIDYTTIKPFDVIEYEIDINAPYIHTGEVSGYVRGFKAELTAGRVYRIRSVTYAEGALNYSIGIFTYGELDGGIDDFLDKQAYNTYTHNSVCENVIECEESGTYYFMILSAASDDEKEIFGEKTNIEVMLGEYDFYTSVDYSNELELGQTERVKYTKDSPNVLVYEENDDGRALGYTVELEGGNVYTFDSLIPEQGLDSGYEIVYVFNENMTGDYYDDLVAYEYWSDTTTFYCPADGKYRILVLGNFTYSGDVDAVLTNDISTEVSINKTEFLEIDIYDENDLIEFGIKLEEGAYEAEALMVNILDDIDMSAEEWFSPSNYYSALVINGNDNSITGLVDSLVDDGGNIIIVNDLSIEFNYNFNNPDEYIYEYIGGFVRDCSTAVFNDCEVSGSVDIVAYYIDGVAGLVGCVDNLYMANCVSTVGFDITAYDAYTVGGLASYPQNVVIENCSYEGDIIFREGYISSCGGIVGEVDNRVIAKDSHAKVSILLKDNADGTDLGGFIGDIEDFSLIENCYTEVDIVAPDSSDVGGFIGEIDKGNVLVNCYTEGSVEGHTSVGGFVGESDCCGDNLFLNCYTTVDVTCYDGSGFIDEFYYGDRFINCYASGTVTFTDESFKENGSFFGDGFSKRDAEVFTNCYVFESDLPVGGVHNGYLCDVDAEIDGLTEVDFGDASAVAKMTAALNTLSRKLSVSTDYNIFGWGNKNSDGGPIFCSMAFIIGDVDNSGEVNADDYILLKRLYFGTAVAERLEDPETVLSRSDVTFDGELNADDYILLKRVYFGMAKL